jgi:orotate phosphoribosyltransferase
MAQVDKVDFVIGPAIGGVLLAYEVAKQFKVRGIFAEKDGLGMKLRAGFQIEPDEKAVVVEDVYTTGGSIQKVIDIVRAYGAEVIAIGAMVDRSKGKVEFGVPTYTLAKVDFSEYKPENCPMCQRRIALVKP